MPGRVGKNHRILSFAVIAGAMMAASCSGGTNRTGSPGVAPSALNGTGSSLAGGSAGADQGGGGAEPSVGGEPRAVAYVNPSGWRIDAPGAMTATSDGGALYQGPSDSLRVTPLVGSPDAFSAALIDVRASIPTSSGFTLISPPRRVSLGATTGAEYEYRVSGPPNPVTGKPTLLRALRLYVPRPGGVFRVEYGSTGPAANWDPQGASDIVMTFKNG